MDKVQLEKTFNSYILSVSGWRTIFDVEGEEGKSGNISQENALLTFLACESFQDFLLAKNKTSLLLGCDSRPTGSALMQIATYCLKKLTVKTINICAAPEIMAYAKKTRTPFLYFSASHNPIGHNGIKFGLETGGVLKETDAKSLIETFRSKVNEVLSDKKNATFNEFLDLWEKLSKLPLKPSEKEKSLSSYTDFALECISGFSDQNTQKSFCSLLKTKISEYSKKYGQLTVIADFNGSARAQSIDKALFESFGIDLVAFNENCFASGIIPEGKNLNFAAKKLKELNLNSECEKQCVLAYMPDCDGDRGNLIFWSFEKKEPLILKAQEVFALCVLSELSFIQAKKLTTKKVAVVVNCATSLRIKEIALHFGAEVFTSEVGEANVVSLAESLEAKGYFVRILGEGSNGGNITFPSKVRDPLNTIFSIVKLLVLRDGDNESSPFYLWCKLSGKLQNYCADFTLDNVLKTLPEYSTTETQENRALLKVNQKNQELLKRSYQSIFEKEWNEKKKSLMQKLNVTDYKAFSTIGENETLCTEDFSFSKNGGLKIVLYDKNKTELGFMWMRGSKTEPVFRLLVDLKGAVPTLETELCTWHKSMLEKADTLSLSK